MKCKKHFSVDYTSAIGVCATCLRERLFSLLAAQSDRRDSDQQPNVSPIYNTCLKSRRLSDPRLCPDTTHRSDGGCDGDVSTHVAVNKKQGRFPFFARLFKPKSQKDADVDDLPIPKSRDAIASSTTCSSPFWLSTKLSSRQKKRQSQLISVDERIHQCDFNKTTVRLRQNRGMSPARVSDSGDGDGDDEITNELSQKTPESSRQTPTRANRRSSGGQSCQSSNISGFSFCLSPLVRASPGRARNQKGGTLPEVSFTGETRTSVKPPFSTATKYCANRSRKIADFGRFNQNH